MRINFILLLISSVAHADPSCRTQHYNEVACHIVWGFMSLFSSVPIILACVLMRIVVDKKNILSKLRNRVLITYLPIAFGYIFCHIGNILIADLNIYDNSWFLCRDLFLIPFIATTLFYFMLLSWLRKREK